MSDMAQQARMIDPYAGRQSGAGLLSDLSERRRSECLNLAVGVLDGQSNSGEGIVKLAEAFYDFVTGKTTVERVTDAIAKSGI